MNILIVWKENLDKYMEEEIVKEEIERAVKYASSSNKLENNQLSDNEANQIIEDILMGKTDKSFLFSVAEMTQKSQMNLTESENKDEMLRTIDGFRGFLDCLEDVREKGFILAHSVWNKGEINDKDFMKEAYNMGLNV